jgi:hypothetical protein
MLAHVLWTFRDAKDVHVTVLDLCETPLFLCRWYAKSVGNNVETISEDIFKYSPDLAFDCVITDAFLTRFSRQDRAAIVRKWASVLVSPTGRVITTARIEQSNSDGIVRASPAQADSFRYRASREAKKWADFLQVAPAEIGNRAQRYAERMTSCPIESADEIHQLFTCNGFKIEQLHTVEVPGEMAPTVYAQIVAVKS